MPCAPRALNLNKVAKKYVLRERAGYDPYLGFSDIVPLWDTHDHVCGERVRCTGECAAIAAIDNVENEISGMNGRRNGVPNVTSREAACAVRTMRFSCQNMPVSTRSRLPIQSMV